MLFFLIALAGFLLDFGTKNWIFARQGMPRESPPIWIVQDVLSLETGLNEGALFGMGRGFVVVFCVLSILASVGILYWLFVRKAARDLSLTVALAAVTAGIFGNLYDRAGLPGLKWNLPGREGEPVYAVRDWIHFQLGWFDWPVFNVADSLLVCGAAVLLWHALRPTDSGQADDAKRVSAAAGKSR